MAEIIDGRNHENIQFARLRRRIDRVYYRLHDNLDEAYYQYWRHGNSKPFFQWDVRPNAVATKRQFELLQGFVWHLYIVVRYLVNERTGDYTSRELDDIVINEVPYDSEVRRSRAWIVEQANRYNVNLSQIKRFVKNWVRDSLDLDIEVE